MAMLYKWWRRFYLSGLAIMSDPIPALRGIMWRIQGKKVRGRNWVMQAASLHPAYYRYWTRYLEDALIQRDIAPDLSGPSVSVIPLIVVQDADLLDAVAATVASIRRTFGRETDILMVMDSASDGPPAPHALTMTGLQEKLRGLSGADYLLPLYSGDTVPAKLAGILDFAVGKSSRAEIIYWDEDLLDEKGRRCDPWFKTDWSMLHFLAQDSLSGAAMVQAPLAATALECQREGSGLNLERFMISAVELEGQGAKPCHVPHVLSHRAPSRRGIAPMRAAATVAHLFPAYGVGAVAGLHDVPQLRWPLPEAMPAVSIVIPTRDHLELLRPCVEGLKTLKYPGEVEVLVVDNGSSDPDVLAYLDLIKGEGVNVIEYPGPFNYSKINNHAVGCARSDYICFLNNDIEVLDGDWLTRLMEHALRDGVAAVGAKLLYPDRTIQHAGVVVGLGQAAGHLFRNVPDDERGYHRMPHVARDVTAVTGACLLLDRKKFEAIGGFDEVNFPVAFNDVDLCLRLVQAGWRNVYAPEAVLIHHESKSRGSDAAPTNIERYRWELSNLQRLWHTETFRDPYFNPNFSRRSEGLYLEVEL